MKTTLLTILVCVFSIQMSNAQWVQVNNGMGNIPITSLVSSGIFIIAGTQTSGIYFSSNNGAAWTQSNLNNQDVRSLVTDGNNFYAGSFSGNGVYKSTDNGATWTQTVLNNRKIRAMAVSGNYIYAGAHTPDNGVYISTDNGTTWIHSALNQIVRSMAVSGNNVYVGSSAFPGGDGVFLSTNNGRDWNQTSLNNGFIGSLAADGNIVVAGSGNSRGLYISGNNGANWTQSLFLINVNVYALKINGNNIYAGTYNYGVYVSNDLGTNWTQRNDGLLFSGSMVFDLCLLNNYLFAGLGFAGEMGVYRRPLSQLTDIKSVSNEVPDKYFLSQNYPNPFNPSTNVEFGISDPGFISLKVYSELGTEVQTLVNENLSPGTYEVEFNGSDLSSGVYFCRLQTENFSAVRRMVLIK